MSDSNKKIIVTSRHCRAADMCLTPGAREFFKRHNLNYRDFIKNGIDADVLIATGDAMALQVVAIAKAEQEATDGQQ